MPGLALRQSERVRVLALIAPGRHDYPWPGADENIVAMMRGAVASWFALGDPEEADPPGYGRLGEIRAPAVMLLSDREYPARRWQRSSQLFAANKPDEMLK